MLFESLDPSIILIYPYISPYNPFKGVPFIWVLGPSGYYTCTYACGILGFKVWHGSVDQNYPHVNINDIGPRFRGLEV